MNHLPETCRGAAGSAASRPFPAAPGPRAALRPAFLATLALGISCLLPGPAWAAGKKKEKESELAAATAQSGEVFNDTTILRLQIEIAEPEMATLRKARAGFGPQEVRESVKATLREGGVVYTNVALHLKGAAGSFRPVDDRPALTLNFARHEDGQRFHGLKKISLNNSVQDATYTSEQVSREVFLKAGVPVPRAGHARVSLNGRDLGLYVLVEGWDKDFLRRHFKNAKGNLYDGGFLKDVDDNPEVATGDDPGDHTALKALADAAKEPDLGRRRERLESTLDVDRFLSYVAVEVMLWDWDGYPMHKNNWRIFHDRSAGRMVFMPHGLDQMFWKPDGSILPPMESLVGRAVLEVPEFRARYLDRLRELNGAVFNAEALAGRVTTIAAKVRPEVAQVDAAELPAFDRAVAGFRDSILRRGKSLTRQLARPVVPVTFDASGRTGLSGWEPGKEFGKPELTRVDGEAAQGALSIRMPAGSSIGTWSASAWLPRGRYALTGRVRTKAASGDPGDTRPGAGLRSSLGRAESYVVSEGDWKTVTSEFSVGDSLVEVRFFCEFRAAQGEALFDVESLRLQRLSAKP